MQTIRHFFSDFNAWLDRLPDSRVRDACTYDRRFLAWWGLRLYLLQLGSRRQLDFELRDGGAVVLANLNRLAGTQQTTLPVHDTLDHFHLTAGFTTGLLATPCLLVYNGAMQKELLLTSAGTTMARGIFDVPPAELHGWLESHGQPAMRVRQIRRWIVAGRAESFEQMTDLPRPLRRLLAQEYQPLATRIAKHLEAGDGTHKLLVRLPDDQLVECVLIQENTRRTACISTQVGCGMGCVFCASGLNGVLRNLTTGEIVEQLVRLRNLLPANERLTNIVVMGMGEPLANLDALTEALQIAGAKDGLDLGARHVTVSTVGLPAKIRRLAELRKQYHLAVSLHAPNDALRTRIVPTNEKTGIAAILEAADYYFEQTGRQVTYEYVLLGGINDLPKHARELAALLRERCAHVNLIPFNDVEGLPYRRPDVDALNAFVAELRKAGISVKVRKRKGSEIDAACGQLRLSAMRQMAANS